MEVTSIGLSYLRGYPPVRTFSLLMRGISIVVTMTPMV